MVLHKKSRKTEGGVMRGKFKGQEKGEMVERRKGGEYGKQESTWEQ